MPQGGAAAAVPPAWWAYVVSYVLATGFGGVIGLSELVSRYKDAPFTAIQTGSAGLYIALNALASAAALSLILQMGWLANLATDPTQLLVMRTLVAAFGAMAFFRTSLFTVRVGNTDVAVGPAGFLQVVLSAADRATDRTRAGPRAQAIAEIMTNISFAKAQEALPTLCFGLMQNVSADEQRTFGLVVKDLQNSKMDDVFKANTLGLQLMNIVGENVLRQAVTVLRRLISDPPKQVVQSIATLQLIKNLDFDKMSGQIVDECLLVSGQMQASNYRASLQVSTQGIQRMKLDPVQKGLLLSAMLISEFSEDILQAVLKSLPVDGAKTVTPAVPPQSPSTSPTPPAPPPQTPSTSASDPVGPAPLVSGASESRA
jgi:hypothetical protein